jgi:hypothetical protein
LFLIAILAISTIGTISAANTDSYSHSDIRANQIGYISLRLVDQSVFFKNDQSQKYSHITRNDDLARIFYDINRTYQSSDQVINWDHSFNSKHTFIFFLRITCYSDTNGWIINYVDWSKGLLVVSDAYYAEQWAHVYYYDTNGNARKEYFLYRP